MNHVQIKVLIAIRVVLLLLIGSHALYAETAPANQEAWSGKLTQFSSDKASPGFTLYPATGAEQVLLLNMNGRVVHRWNFDAMRAKLLPNGNLLVIHGSKWGIKKQKWNALKNKIREYDWSGKLVWEYDAGARIHHDLQRLANGNTIFPVRQELTLEQKALITKPKRRKLNIRSDKIVEVSNKGVVAWSWDAADHLDLNACGKSKCIQPTDWTHINTTVVLPENRWYDSGDGRFKPGNLMVLLRSWWAAMIIDRTNSKVVWSYSGDYKGGLSGGHEAHMIEKGLPGAGNILIFDNGRLLHQGRSYALELNPTTKELVWVYDTGKDFYSKSAGALQRLPNGNTLLSEDLSGRVFEVTPQKQIVWEYRGSMGVARAKRYPYNHCRQFTHLN
ncbi:arylsulfotransferase family protein [Oligoflexia bacterium]|nr:arylsulfotransferase family protein [Oligoflexia bacterium]